MKKLDPLTMADWQIAEEAEKEMVPIDQIAKKMSLMADETISMGRNVIKVDSGKVLKRIKNNSLGKYVVVTAITPTILGEGKTTTTMGLVEGLGKCGKRVSGAIRQPSGGPTFNIKGSAAGGGLSQCIPLTPFSIRLTGDIDSITNSHNLCMVALTSRMQHEANYDDERLLKSGLKRLNIDPTRVAWKWAIDFCAQALRNITIGKGGKMDGVEMNSGFQISVSSELMAILAVANDLADMVDRIGHIVVAYSKNGAEITTKDLEVDKAMAAWLIEAINPNLLQTIEGQPVFVHAGPFANIAIGQSSIIADRIGLGLSEYHVTESGFGSDIGYEKFWNIKCRISGLKPDAVVLVATIRALKMHGGGNLEKGSENLKAHIDIVKQSGISPIVCLNAFSKDLEGEINLIKAIVKSSGVEMVVSHHWLKGGEGAKELAEAVIASSEKKNGFKLLYEDALPLHEKIERIATGVYGAMGVKYENGSFAKIKELEKEKDFGVCMVKTQLSLSHDPELKGRPQNWYLPIRDVLIYRGAKLVVPVAGDIKLMPGTGSDPAFRHIDIDLSTGKVRGLY